MFPIHSSPLPIVQFRIFSTTLSAAIRGKQPHLHFQVLLKTTHLQHCMSLPNLNHLQPHRLVRQKSIFLFTFKSPLEPLNSSLTSSFSNKIFSSPGILDSNLNFPLKRREMKENTFHHLHHLKIKMAHVKWWKHQHSVSAKRWWYHEQKRSFLSNFNIN